RGLAPDLLFRLTLPEGFREGRPVIWRMALGADDADRTRGIDFAHGMRRGVGGHAAAHDQIGVIGHRAPVLGTFSMKVRRQCNRGLVVVRRSVRMLRASLVLLGDRKSTRLNSSH